jgi:hypothetical protein
VATSEALWPAAVSERSAVLLHGRPRRATVLGAFPTALYLQVGGHAQVLPVVTAGGLRLPTALAVGTSLPTRGWGVQPGDEVVLGHGAVRLPGLAIRAVRTWRPRPVPAAALAGASQLDAVNLPWRAGARTLAEVLLADDSGALTEQVGAFVGAGPGLTPSGDDVLCGILLGLRLHARVSRAVLDRLWRAVRPRLTTTTSLSAALLTEASQGYAVDPVVRLAETLVAGPAAAVAEALPGVLGIGHSSGPDLLGGLAGCLDALEGDDLSQHHLATTRRSLP